MFNPKIDYVIARSLPNASGDTAPMVNVVGSALAWELFWESVISGAPVSVRAIDRLSDAYMCEMLYHAGSLQEIRHGSYKDGKKIYVKGSMALDVKP